MFAEKIQVSKENTMSDKKISNSRLAKEEKWEFAIRK